jgi:hypothetical protein
VTFVILDRYQSCGLEKNPFTTDREAVWLDRGWSEPVVGGFVQIMGDKGFGKTSHLEHWRNQSPGRYRHVPPGWRRWLSLPVRGKVVYWDEADRVPVLVLSLALLIRRGRSVVVGTHRDLSIAASRWGYRVTTIELGVPTEDEKQHWAQAQIESVAPTGHVLGSVPEGPPDESWRDVGDRLHIWAAQQVEIATARLIP